MVAFALNKFSSVKNAVARVQEETCDGNGRMTTTTITTTTTTMKNKRYPENVQKALVEKVGLGPVVDGYISSYQVAVSIS